ncbi:hypothetical protein [uncultured Phycicoccus sp.]|uniref:hypothetical protein n=1 Tax=uncultured Phycicoccus sp. TaxID=661422 RepID=UPI002632DB41|nr:hypothetical protein [uncultured Phycicoccus sp.]
MQRRLEELDRLDRLAADPDEVTSPGGLSSRTDPRAWEPGRPVGDGTQRTGRRTMVLVASVALASVAWAATPSLSGWVDYLVHGDPAYRVFNDPSRAAVGVATSASASGASDGRVRPAVPIPAAPSPEHYSFMQTQDGSDPVTFDPCRAIHYVVREVPGVGGAGREAVSRAVTQVSLATGLAFVFDGFTDEAPSEDRGTGWGGRSSAWKPVLIAWSDPTETPELDGDTAGLGGGAVVRGDDGRLRYVSGSVTLDAPALTPDLATARGAAEVQAVIAHELAHVVGAGHADSPDELMAAQNRGQTGFGPGDRYVLAVLGNGDCASGL